MPAPNANETEVQGVVSPPPPTKRPKLTMEEMESRLMSTAYGLGPDSMRAQSDVTRQSALEMRKPGEVGIVEAIAGGVKKIVTNPGETTRSAVRGPGNAIDDLAETSIAIGAWLLGSNPVGRALVDDEWKQVYDAIGARGIAEAGTEFMDRTNDAIFGPRSEEGAFQFVEDVSQFVTGFIAAGRIKVSAGGPSLAALGPVVGGAVRGALVDFAAFDPYEAQLAELAARANIAGIREVGQLLSVEGDDGPIVARLKRVAGGVIAGAAIDGIVAAARLFRNKKVLLDPAASAAQKEAAAAEIKVQAGKLNEIANGTFASNNPVVVKPTENGTYRVEANPQFSEEARRLKEFDAIANEARDLSLLPTRTPEQKARLNELMAKKKAFDLPPEIPIEQSAMGRLATMEETPRLPGGAPDIVAIERRRTGGSRREARERRKAVRINLINPNEAGSFGVVTRNTIPGEKPFRLSRFVQGEDGNPEALGHVDFDSAEEAVSEASFEHGLKPKSPERRAGERREAPEPRRIIEDPAMQGPEFNKRWMAEAQAASINEALSVRFTAESPLSMSKMTEVFDLVKRIERGANNPADLVEEIGKTRFNFTYMDAPEKAENLLKAVGKALAPVFDATQGRPSVTIAETVDRTLQLAGMLTREDADDYFRNVGSVLKNTPENLLALNARVVEVGEQVAKWSAVLDARPSDVVAQMEARRALRAYVHMAADVAGSNSGVGRGLNALKFRGDPKLKGMKFKGEPGAVEGAVKEGFEPDIVADMTAAQLRDVTRLFRLTKSPKVLFNTLASELKPVNMGKAAAFGRGMLEYFYNSVLSNPATHAAIFLANGTVSAVEDGVRFLAGAVRRDPEMIRQAADMLTGRLVYLKQSLKGMGMAFKAGHSIIDPRPVYRAIPGIGGEIVRTLGTRPIAAMDEFWRVNNNLAFTRMRSAAVARREAAAQGLKGKQLDEFVAQRVDADVRNSIDPSGASRLPEAREFAALPTFSTPLQEGSFGSSLEGLVQDHPWLTPIMPFVRTSINVLDYSFGKMTPLGLLSKDIRKTIQSGGPEGAHVATRMAVGTTIWATAGLLAFSGDITGRGPTDPNLRKMWLASHQPYSVRVDGKWVSYKRAEPFATPLSIAADLAHILRDNADDLQSSDEGSKVFYALVAATAQGVTNKTYLSGLVEFMDAIGSGQSGKVKGFADGLLATAVPSVVQVANDDPYMRETRNLLDALANRIPGWSQSLPARYNVFGEPVMKTPGNVQRTLNPMPIKDATPGLEEEFLQLQRAFTAPPSTQRFGDISVNMHDRKYANKNGGDQTPYERLMEIVKEQDLRGQIQSIVDSPAFKRAGEGTEVFAGGRKYKELQSRIERVYARAERKMLSEYPELRHDLLLLQRATRASQRSDVKGQGILDRLQ